ncbi:MAG: hypothetical protein ABIS69_02340 [Sediminibacterium sp.]
MKRWVWAFAFLLFACGGKQQDYRKADDALNAGREYLNATMQGDFSKAAFYALPDATNERALKELEKIYREKDKEGRQQFRTASLNISEVKDLSDSSTEIHYNNSFDKQPHTLWVIKRNGDWLVDLGKK